MTDRDNVFYIFIFGVIIGIVVSYSQLITLFMGIFLGLCYNNRVIFEYIHNYLDKLKGEE